MADDIKFNKKKEKDFSEWFFELLKAADVIDQRYPTKGFIIHKEIAAIAEREMYKLFEKELDKTKHKMMRFPAVIPESVFAKEIEHIEGFTPEVFWIEKGGKDKLPEKIGLRPTSETAMYTMYSKWIRSYRDLPLKVYQEAQVWRYETKHTRPLLRDREFYWIEAHDVFATKKEAEEQVTEDMNTTKKVMYEKLGIPFLFFKRPEWDKFNGAEYTFGADVLMPNGLVIQQPSTHFLGQNFSKPYDIKFLDEDETEKYAWQTCYGPAISRILASVISIHGDDKGLIFPWEIAPYQIVIIPIYKKDSNQQTIKNYCKELQKKLSEKGIRTELDLSEKRPGAKYYYWELRGASIRIEVGAREIQNKELTIVRRDKGEKQTIKEEKLQEYLKQLPEKIIKNLKQKADEQFKNALHEASSLEELKKQLNKGGFVKINLCSRDADGEKCAEIIKSETDGGEVRGTLHNKKEKPTGKCIICGKKANAVVYVAKSY